MARFYGAVGFEILEETRPGIYTPTYRERNYKGDVVKSNRKWSPSESVNDNLDINNDISIISDSFALSNFGVMRYVRWMEQVFSIKSAMIDTERHRITLNLGGIFNVSNSD